MILIGLLVFATLRVDAYFKKRFETDDVKPAMVIECQVNLMEKNPNPKNPNPKNPNPENPHPENPHPKNPNPREESEYVGYVHL